MILSEAISVLITAPGSLVYHLTLAISLALLFGIARAHYAKTTDPTASRWSKAAGLLLFCRILYMVIAVLVLTAIFEGDWILPPADRFIGLIGLAFLAWAFLFPLSPRRLNIILVATLIIATLGLIATVAILATGGSDGPFNQSIADAIWGLAGLLIAIITTIILFTQRPTEWNLAAGAFSLVALGYAFHLALGPKNGSLPGFVRWTELAAYPLLTVAIARVFSGSLIVERIEPVQELDSIQVDETIPVPPAWIDLTPMISAETPATLVKAAARAVAHSFRAELCLVLTPPDSNGDFSIATGYDLIMEIELAGAALNSQQCPVLATAFSRHRTLSLPATSHSPDLKFLQQVLNIDTTGPVLLVPLVYDGDLEGGILLLSPFSRRRWLSEDQRTLENIAEHLAYRLQQLRHTMQPSPAVATEAPSITEARSHIERLEKENIRLREQLRTTEERIDQEDPDSVAALLELHEEAQRTIQTLEAEIERLSSELQQALEELSESRARLSTLQAASDGGVEDQAAKHDMDAIASIAQELRQPMSSVLGYTDLLLSESVGLLGAMQRKFLDRVRNGIERMGTLLNNMIQVTAIETGALSLSPGPVDLLNCIEVAISQASTTLREKNLALRMDLPEELPPVLGDEDAVTQIMVHLINNAIGASPESEEIIVAARIQQAEEAQFLMLTFSDAGEGIPSKDIGRVFKRVYEASDVPIQGLGDNGIGLSIVHALVDAIGGRIWFDSKEGVGSTFTVLLPIANLTTQPTTTTETEV
ncbi:MAG: GAF domain-containing protein [Anaerolineales bacterium]|nr:GAF domain-containing protein [Anaerolineales bacterium]